MEVANLLVYDLDSERGTLMVRQGKGKKDRMVPIGERAIAWIRKYVDEGRPALLMPPDEGVLFLGQEGEASRARPATTQLVCASTSWRRTRARAARATCFATRARP